MARALSPPLTAAEIISRSIRRHVLFGTVVVLVLFGVAGRWAFVTQISGAVVAPGQLVVEGNVKKVQHPTGGVVGKLFVKDGDHVNAQDVLLKLDDTSAKANLAIASNSVDELSLRRERLVAEINGSEIFELPEGLKTRGNDPAIHSLFLQESSVLKTKLESMNSQRLQLGERIKQLEEEIKGVEQQAGAKKTEIEIANQQLAAMTKLLGLKLEAQQRVDDKRKEVTQIEGERGSLLANIAQTKGKISETKLQLLQVGQDHMTEVSKELRDTEPKLAEAVQRSIESKDQLTKTEIRSPQQGVIYQLTVHAAGGVISPGEAIMMVVPDGDTLAVEAKIAPTDIDQVFIGQKANLRFTAFNARTTPEANGEIEFISPDLITDQRSGASYYTARVKVVGGADKLKLLPGMPAEAFIQTGDRSVLSYIAKPLADQLARAFKEG